MSAYLLDTHSLIWLLTRPENLTTLAQDIICYDDNQIFYSMSSIWEIAIKFSIGKLELVPNWQQIFAHELPANAIELLHPNWQATQILQDLPFHHRDPFDRMLIAQAIANHLTLITKDGSIKRYSVKTIW